MQFYWSLKSIPELSGLPPRERRRIWRAAYWKTFRHWQIWAAGIAILLFTLIGSWIDREWISPALVSPDRQTLIGALIGTFLGGSIFTQVTSHLARPYIRERLLQEPQ
jgi:hypothetical protein